MPRSTPCRWPPNSGAYVNAIGASAIVHADFGSGTWDGGPIGIPFVSVADGQPDVAIHYTAYGSESDPGPFPVPADAPVEGGSGSDGDRHVLVVDRDNCLLYELYRAFPQADGSWNADSGALYDLRSNALRPDGWTSADAAGLPIFPGLVRYDEVAAGEITHAIRFTAPRNPPGLCLAGAPLRLVLPAIPRCRRWGSASASRPARTFPATPPRCRSSCAP